MIKHLKQLFEVKGHETYKELFPSMVIECPNVNTCVMFMNKNNLTTSHGSSWVSDTRCGFHICNNDQELKKGRILLKGQMDICVGNRARVVALAIGNYNLTLPSGMFDNCYFVTVLARNIAFILIQT